MSRRERDEDEVPPHIQCWIPGKDIDLVVMALYLREYIDPAVTIRPSNNGQNESQPGYTIGAIKTLSVANVRDIIEDSRAWEEEKLTREYRSEPYAFHESDVWEDRKARGISKSTVRPRQRNRNSPATSTTGATNNNNNNTTATNRHTPTPVSAERELSPPERRPSVTTNNTQLPSFSRHQPTEKAQAQYSLNVIQPTTSNMTKYVAPPKEDRHRS